MKSQTSFRKAMLAIGMVAASAATVGAQGREISMAEMEAISHLTTADNSGPGGMWPGPSPAPTSGNPTSFNDPAHGFNNTRYWAKDPKYSGVTRLIMTMTRKNLTTGVVGSAAFLCSGALINNGQSVLTAAHCVNNRTQNEGGTLFEYKLVSTEVQLGQHFGGNTTHEPGAGAPSVNQAFNHVQTVGTANTEIHPGYSGQVIDEHDIAVLNLPTAVNPLIYRSYELYMGDAFNTEYNITGWGGRGNGANGTVSVGGSTGSGARIRQGQNSWETTYDDPRWTAAFKTFLFGARGGQDVYLADFDNGLAPNDALCQLSFATLGGVPIWTDPANRPCGLGEGIDEVSSAGGDSGGPSFIMGQVAAVTSFGQTWGTGFFGDVKAGLQSSFGEINGMTRVDINASWVQGAVVPEPSTIVLFATGFVGLVAAARRRGRRQD